MLLTHLLDPLAPSHTTGIGHKRCYHGDNLAMAAELDLIMARPHQSFPRPIFYVIASLCCGEAHHLLVFIYTI
jgi:hypothetical protein